jgi:hypothetical protein
MDKCFCQTDNDLCHERTTPSFIPITESLKSSFSMPIVPPLSPSRSVRQGELILGLYDINQQRLIDNGGSVFIGDRLFIEIKYRTGFN